ncbi:hypothetical protein MMC13_006191 [Lambiella insularis]|nr:hypothetical protein [Lambiella insularis]
MNLPSRNIFLVALAGTSSIALLYLALFVSPQLYWSQSTSVAVGKPAESVDMTIRVEKFTPEVLLSAPRRSAAIPNAAGSHALYTVSTYSFESHEKTKEIRLLDLSNKQTTLVTNENKTSEPHWLEEDILYLKAGEGGATELIVAEARDLAKTYTVAIIPAPISDAKLKILEKGKVAVVFAAIAKPDGSLYNPENEHKKYSTGRLYDSTMVRHWDKYVSANKNSLWYGLFTMSKPHIAESKGRYGLSTLVNALKETQIESPIPPFPGTEHYDISSTGIIFVAKDPSINPAFNTKCNLYFLEVSNFTTATTAKPQLAEVESLEGAASSPVFSPSGRALAYLKMKKNGYEADRNRLLLIPDVSKLSTVIEVLRSDDGTGNWDRSPSSVMWSNDGQALYLTAEEKGKTLLFKVDVPTSSRETNKMPEKLTSTGSISSVLPLSTSSVHLFLSSSSLVDSSIYMTLDPANPSSLKQISSLTHNGSSLGLSTSQVSSTWFDAPNNPGVGKHRVHAWIVKPSNIQESSKYPLAMLIHGGPQSAWADSWSTRWNPAIFAEQGYVVVCPNPTGSTGYGQAFTDAIGNNWGGAPYTDLVACFSHIEESMPYVDVSRAVALGASYGGYMVNWINGHPLGRKFAALVCHDGVFSMTNQLSSDEQYFPNHDLGGPPFSEISRANWGRWDPSKYVENWATPQLVIHNELDYRLPISEGLGAFNMLQERGVQSRLLTFPDENHWVLKEENSLVWHKVVLDWVNGFVGLEEYSGGNVGVDLQSGPSRVGARLAIR